MIEIKVDGHTLFEMNTPKDVGYLQEQLKALQGNYNLLLTEIANVRDERDTIRAAAKQGLEQLKKITWARPVSKCPSKLVEQLETLALMGAAELKTALKGTTP